MQKLGIKVFFLLTSLLFSFSCGSVTREDGGKSKISDICSAQKIFFKKNSRYATLDELVKDELIEDIWFRNSGYKLNIKLTETGYFGSAIPNDFSKGPMFYVDEKGIIKTHYGDTNIQPDDPECSYPNGAKCPCYDEE